MQEVNRAKNLVNACLVCGQELLYADRAELMECVICHKKYTSNAKCIDNHYICDECHSHKGIEVIVHICQESKSQNPIEIAKEIMSDPYIYMHGPEHHILVGASLLTAYVNSGGNLNLEDTLPEMVLRGKQVPGGFCGLHGCCGAAVSTGIFYSIISDCTPLSDKEWQNANLMTSAALSSIAQHGGPRCCKRDSFLAMKEAVVFTEQARGIKMELPDQMTCEYFMKNAQCLKTRCLFFPANAR